MFAKTKKTLQDYLIEELSFGPAVILDLITLIKKKRPGTTKQGVYAALRKLKKDEVIVIHTGEASLNIPWLTKIGHFIAVAQHHYFQKALSVGHFANLQDGEKIQYFFQNPVLTDAFWNHALFILIKTSASYEPFIAYNPHCWFFIAHPENERALRDFVIQHKRRYLIYSTAKTPIDRSIRREFDGVNSQYYMSDKPLMKKQNYYLNVIDDFLIEVWLDKKITQQMEDFYHSIDHLTPESQTLFRHIIEARGRTKLVISRNAKKAAQLKKKLLRQFYIPRNRDD